MATWNAKNLSEGQLPNAKGTILAATGYPTIIRQFHVYNTSAVTTETVIVYYKKGTSRGIGRAVLGPLESADFIDEGLPTLELDATDIIEGVTTNATTVDYTIGGAVFS